MNRRQLLGGVLTGTTAALSGCGVLESSGPEVVLDHVTVRNLDDSDHVVDVEVLRDGELFRQKTVSVTGWTGDVPPEDSVAGIVLDESEKRLAEYVVRAKFEQDEEWESARLRYLTDRGGCAAGEVRITESGAISFWTVDIPEPQC